MKYTSDLVPIEEEAIKALKLRCWGDGPWMNEPDFVKFEHDGFTCVINRRMVLEGHNNDHLSGGYLCGYLILPPSHPWFGKHYDNIDCEVHGGLTFCDGAAEEWAIGFDCAHSWDVSPSLVKFMQEESGLKGLPEFIYGRTYRDIEFVRSQLMRLISQAKSAMEKT